MSKEFAISYKLDIIAGGYIFIFEEDKAFFGLFIKFELVGLLSNMLWLYKWIK